MITFDTPYTGTIKQGIGKSTISIKLQDASIESAKLKKLSSKYIKSLSITPMSGYTKIVASVPSSVSLKASKTADSYGLRLRFSTKIAKKKRTLSTKQSINSPFVLPTKKDDDINQSYYVVVAILIIGIMILFYIKTKVTPKQNIPNQKQKKASPWLFKESATESKNMIDETNSDVSIRFQKSIDNENSVVMLDFGEQSYLVLMGNNNVLLDRFKDNKPDTQDDFNTILQNRHKELDDFLHTDNNSSTKESKEPLQAYKERAAAIIYEDA